VSKLLVAEQLLRQISMPLMLTIVPTAAFMIASACQPMPLTKVHVVTVVEDTTVGTSYNASELNMLSERLGSKPKHPTYGFYVSSVAYGIAVAIGNDRGDVCAGPLDIKVIITLASRHIEIGRDMVSDSCRFGAVLAHYQHHAEADEATFRHYVAIATTDLSQVPLPKLLRSESAAGPNSESIARTLESNLKPVLVAMGTARKKNWDEVDSPAEIRRLRAPCDRRT
jgi:hypothetical protein